MNKSEHKKSVDDFGKFGLISHLTSNVIIRNKTTITGIGDDGSEVEISAQGWKD
jgi:hypothetical protein